MSTKTCVLVVYSLLSGGLGFFFFSLFFKHIWELGNHVRKVGVMLFRWTRGCVNTSEGNLFCLLQVLPDCFSFSYYFFG